MFLFQFHYGFPARELYLSPDQAFELRSALRLKTMLKHNGAKLYTHDGPLMLVTRFDQQSFACVAGRFIHAVLTDDEQVALWAEVPQG